MNKIIIFFMGFSASLLFFSKCNQNSAVVIYTPKTPYEKRLSNIKKATVLIYHLTGSRGSGALIEGNGTVSSILTNAHVCLNDYAEFINNENYKQKFLKESTTFHVLGNDETKTITVENKKMQFDVYKDYCFIPVQNESFKKAGFSFLNSHSSPEVLAESKGRNDYNEDSLLMFTRNYARDGEVFIKKGFVKYFHNQEFSIQAKSNEKKKYLIQRGPAYLSTIDVVPGDSGSLIFNSGLDVVGVAFGYKLDAFNNNSERTKVYNQKTINDHLYFNLPELQFVDNQEEEDEDFLKTFLDKKKIHPRSIPNLKNGINELYGYFISIQQVASD